MWEAFELYIKGKKDASECRDQKLENLGKRRKEE